MSSTDVSQLTKADIPKLRNIPVITADGEEIGHVGDAYYDESTERLECVGVPGDAIGLTRRVIPVSGATLDADGRLQLPYTKAQIENSPEWGEEDDSDERYGEVRGHYGGEVDTEDQAMTRSEEELAVGKREVEAGKVRLRKWVEAEPVEADVELRRETAEVRRERIDQPAGDVELREQEIEVPLHEEEAVVEKQTVAKERVSVDKDVETERETISDELRKERVELEEDR
jgi:uncharacterized protein (TIGR02271 family)